MYNLHGCNLMSSTCGCWYEAAVISAHRDWLAGGRGGGGKFLRSLEFENVDATGC